MVGGGMRDRDDGSSLSLGINSTNIFAALDSRRRKSNKKKGDKSSDQGSTSFKGKDKSDQKEADPPQQFWAPAPVTAKSWADVDNDNDYYATTAPPPPDWGSQQPVQSNDEAKETLSQGEEQDKLVAEMMRYILFKNHQHPGVPVKREELTQLVTKNYRQRNLPNLVILQTQKKFASIFGYEMKELQRARSSKNNSIRSSQQSTVEVKSYVLKSMLPEELRTRFVVDKDSLHLLGLTLAVVATLKLAGGKIPEDTLWQHLRRLGLDEHEERHPVFGNVKQAMETITKQRYIQTEKVSSPEGDITVYELAERALDEVVSTKVKESIMQIVKNGIPTTGASEAGS